MTTTELRFRIEADERCIEASVRVPAEPVRPRDLLPIILPFTNAVVGLSEAACNDRGETISCRAGCSACCCQLVPVSQPEAAYLAGVVDALPEPGRQTLKDRFRSAQERSAEALSQVHATSGESRVAALAAAARPYFDLGIECPFLEDRNCSIYEHRPAICREYLVTTSPDHCAALDLERIDRVPVPVTVSSTLIYFAEGDSAGEPRAMPLIDALDWAANAEPPEPIPGETLFRRFLQLFYESPATTNPRA